MRDAGHGAVPAPCCLQAVGRRRGGAAPGAAAPRGQRPRRVPRAGGVPGGGCCSSMPGGCAQAHGSTCLVHAAPAATLSQPSYLTLGLNTNHPPAGPRRPLQEAKGAAAGAGGLVGRGRDGWQRQQFRGKVLRSGGERGNCLAAIFRVLVFLAATSCLPACCCCCSAGLWVGRCLRVGWAALGWAGMGWAEQRWHLDRPGVHPPRCCCTAPCCTAPLPVHRPPLLRFAAPQEAPEKEAIALELAAAEPRLVATHRGPLLLRRCGGRSGRVERREGGGARCLLLDPCTRVQPLVLGHTSPRIPTQPTHPGAAATSTPLRRAATAGRCGAACSASLRLPLVSLLLRVGGGRCGGAAGGGAAGRC